MGFRDVAWNATKWTVMKKHLGYSKEEMEVFRSNPRNADVLSKAPALLDKTIIVEAAPTAAHRRYILDAVDKQGRPVTLAQIDL